MRSGDNKFTLHEYGWFRVNSNGKTHSVGQLRPNAFGIYDLHGNVCEWCADWLAVDYYAKAPVDDPSGSPTGSGRVLRGGGWINLAGSCRSAYRYDLPPGQRDYNLGFRLAAVLAEK